MNSLFLNKEIDFHDVVKSDQVEEVQDYDLIETSDSSLCLFVIILLAMDLICAPNALLCGNLSLMFNAFFIILSIQNYPSLWIFSFISSFNGASVSLFGFTSTIYQLAYNKILNDAGFPNENFDPFIVWLIAGVHLGVVALNIYLQVINLSCCAQFKSTKQYNTNMVIYKSNDDSKQAVDLSAYDDDDVEKLMEHVEDLV